VSIGAPFARPGQFRGESFFVDGATTSEVFARFAIETAAGTPVADGYPLLENLVGDLATAIGQVPDRRHGEIAN
jgi:hypothetical protein